LIETHATAKLQIGRAATRLCPNPWDCGAWSKSRFAALYRRPFQLLRRPSGSILPTWAVGDRRGGSGACPPLTPSVGAVFAPANSANHSGWGPNSLG